MSKHEKTSILDYSIGLDLLRFENVCYYELIKRFVDVFNSEKAPLIYGIEEGLDAYFSSGLQLDTAVFLYEAVKHMGCIAPKETEAFMSTSEFKILETVHFDDYESMNFFQRVLKKSGVFEQLEAHGCTDGMTVSIYDFEFDFVQ